MWTRFKNWMATDKAGAITNGFCAMVWIWIGASAEGEYATLVHWLGAFNAAMFGFAAGGRLSDHFRRPTIEMWRTLAMSQQQNLLQVIRENQELALKVEELQADDREVS